MAEEKSPEVIAKEAAEKAFAAAAPPAGAPLLAARVGDMHICPMIDGVKPHVGGPIMPPGVPTVLIGGMPAAVATKTQCTCVGPPDLIIKGSATVLIGGMPAARLSDMTVHGGMIIAGCPTVTIGG